MYPGKNLVNTVIEICAQGEMVQDEYDSILYYLHCLLFHIRTLHKDEKDTYIIFVIGKKVKIRKIKNVWLRKMNLILVLQLNDEKCHAVKISIV